MEKKTNSGAFFKNDKGDNPNRPDYKGVYVDANGNEHWASAWVKKDKSGNTYLSFTTQAKETKVDPLTVSVTNTSKNIDFRNSNSLAEAFNSDDELPF
jgi:hypothetical protein